MKQMRTLLATALVSRLFPGVIEARAEITVELPGEATMEFVWIEPGTFLMGSPLEAPEYRYASERPQHQVAITRGFYLGKYEITQEQWKAVMGRNPSYRPGPNRPVELITWESVQTFVHRLNQAAGHSLYRLPAEAEWEYAARAATTTRWSFGDDESLLGDYAWYLSNNDPEGPKEVGLKQPNPWGLYDMHGNVWEWVQDWHGEYTHASQVDPAGPVSGTHRIVRGGIFNGHGRHVRSAFRGLLEPPEGRTGIGARLLLEAQETHSLRTGSEATPVSPESWGRVKAGKR
jgi:formylglycine-generating enzyme required for sulfatase activity